MRRYAEYRLAAKFGVLPTALDELDAYSVQEWLGFMADEQEAEKIVNERALDEAKRGGGR